MKTYKDAENIEALALKFLSQSESKKKQRQNSISTIRDSNIFDKRTPSTIHTRNGSKILSIVSNNIVIAEYNFEFFKTKKLLYHLPQKVIEEIDVFSGDEEDNLIEDLSIIEKTNIGYDLNYDSIYMLMNDLYEPLIQGMGSIEDFIDSLEENMDRIEKWTGQLSPFEKKDKMSDELYMIYIYEIISIGFVVYLYQINTHYSSELSSSISQEDNESVYQLLTESMGRLYENVILVILFNGNKDNPQSSEKLCLEYVNQFFKEGHSLSSKEIIVKFNENIKEIKQCLIKLTEIAINHIYQNVNTALVSSVSSEFIEEVNYFDKLLLLLKENKTIDHLELKSLVMNNYAIFKTSITQSIIKVPYLPPMDNDKYKYTLVLDLDETLVHFVEEGEKAYVQVRPHAEAFLDEMGKYYEIVIFTAAAEDYADIVLKELDKKNSILYRLYRRHTLPQNGVFLKDLSKLGRDLKRVCIIDNNQENFSLQPENGLHISSFFGEPNDNELMILSKDLLLIKNENRDDIRLSLGKIRKVMEKRYNNTHVSK